MSSESNFAYSLKYNTHFIVKNITGYTDAEILAEEDLVIPLMDRSPRKMVRIFNYPINPGDTRDLLQIPGVQEEDIRSSLLKGVLRHKFLCGDIALVSSNIDLLQFSDKQRAFLFNFGFTEGLVIGLDELGDSSYGPDNDTIGFIETQGGGKLLYKWVQEVQLIGVKNSSNRTFHTPDKFIYGIFITGDQFHINIKVDGKNLYEGIDYTLSESGGTGTGYDTIYFKTYAPKPRNLLFATYAVAT